MSRLALTVNPSSAAGLNLTTALQALTGFTGVQWSNTGREVLYVSVGATPTNVTENIGTLVLGQGVTAPVVALLANDAYLLGPFPSAYDQPSSGTNQIYLDFSSVATVSVALAQIPGVF